MSNYVHKNHDNSFILLLNIYLVSSSNSNSLYGGILKVSATANSIFREIGYTKFGVSTCDKYPGLNSIFSAKLSCVIPFNLR